MKTTPRSDGYFSSFDGTKIYYELRGEGQPFVFVYGIACLMNHWHHQVSYFSEFSQTLLLDFRGHHKSDPVRDEASATVEACAKDLIGLVKHLGLKDVIFVGHSFGGPVLLKAYDLDPSLFKGLVFINAFAKNPIKGMFGLDLVEPFYFWAKNFYLKSPTTFKILWKYVTYNPLAMRVSALAGGFNLQTTHFKDIEVYARGVSHMDLYSFLMLFEDMMKFDGTEILSKITKPCLVISGENDHITPKDFQEELQQRIKGCEFVWVPYGSHCTQLDFPDYINLKIREFYEKIENPQKS